MAFVLYPELTLQERVDKLTAEASKKENRNYSRSLGAAEIDVEKGRYAQDAIDYDTEEEKLDNIKKDFKARMDNIETRMKERLGKIKTGKVAVSGILYGIADHANSRMMFYDQHGELVDSRELLPEEKQGNVFNKKGTQGAQDLPLETQNVVKGKLLELGMGERGEFIPHEEVFDHDEDGWAKMKDEQLMAKYGTTDIAVIRQLVWSEEFKVWEMPDGKGKGAKGTKKGPKTKK